MRDVTVTIPLVIYLAALALYGFLVYGFSLSPQRALSFSHSQDMSVDLNWYPPNATWITNLTSVINGTGTYGLAFEAVIPQHGQYVYCNMEHVRPRDYVVPNRNKYELKYVEVVHRHHKRTPYASNGFPIETTPWECDNSHPYSFGSLDWSIYTSSMNPFQDPGLHGTCLFPQITEGGLEDSRQHGIDLQYVYVNNLSLISDLETQTSFRVTNNVITSQVAHGLIPKFFPSTYSKDIELQVQPPTVDSLEPKYFCPKANDLLSTYGPGSQHPTWKAHLEAARPIFDRLDAISGVSPTNPDFHISFDHYFDNLSSKQCNGHALPCSATNSSNCVSQDLADTVYRLGQWEYSWLYRGSPKSFQTSVAAYGVWFAELAQNIRDAVDGSSTVVYRHNIAHDGSMSRILSILQVDVMVWPGMGSEVVFEIYKDKGSNKFVLRILWGGSVLRSSNLSLGYADMIDLERFLGYIDGLVGRKGSHLLELCRN